MEIEEMSKTEYRSKESDSLLQSYQYKLNPQIDVSQMLKIEDENILSDQVSIRSS